MSGAGAWPLIRSPAEQLPGMGVGGGGSAGRGPLQCGLRKIE